MKVLIITGTFELGGAENHALKLATYLKEKYNCEIQFWGFTNPNGTLYKRCVEAGFTTRIITEFIRFQKFPLLIFQLVHYRKQIKEFSPDVCISFNMRPNLFNGLVTYFSGVKCRIWSQQSVINYSFTNFYEVLSTYFISAFISNAYHASEKLQNTLPKRIKQNRFHVVHNGLEPKIPKFNESYWNKRLNKKEFDCICTMVGSITITKDHTTLFNAWVEVVKECHLKGINPLLVLAGRPTESIVQKLVDFATVNNIVNNILFLGEVDDISGLNRASDIGILSSQAEGLPNSIMEQMAESLPIVGTDIDGIREVVGSDNYGYLASIGDGKDLAKKILLFIFNESQRKRVGKSNAKRIEEHFKLSKMCEDTMAIIKQYLK